MPIKKYDRKPRTVQAMQWEEGATHPAVETKVPRIVRDNKNGKYYYIEHLDKPGFCWLSYARIPGPVPLSKREDKRFGWIQFEEKVGDDVYHRKMIPFQTSELRPDLEPEVKEEALAAGSNVLVDYAYANNWEDADLSVAAGYLQREGGGVVVKQGDYVVQDGDDVTSFSKELFEEHYEPSLEGKAVNV